MFECRWKLSKGDEVEFGLMESCWQTLGHCWALGGMEGIEESTKVGRLEGMDVELNCLTEDCRGKLLAGNQVGERVAE